MTSAFPEAMTSGIEELAAAMPTHEKDRHVLACAVIAKADCIVTANLKHYPAHEVSRFGIETLHPDEFLVHQWNLSEQIVRTKLHDQARSVGKNMSDHLTVLGKSVPSFVAVIRSHV